MTMTYNSLIEQVLAYMDRTDQDVRDEVPNFISQAEQRIARESKNIGLEQYVVSNFIVGQPVYQKPARWRRSLTMNYGVGETNDTRVQMYLRRYDYIRAYWPDPTVRGKPLYYADYGYSNFIVCPTPDDTYPFEFGYLELPEPLSESNQTNWLTNYAPDVLLYATLLEAMPYLKDDDRIPVWQMKYKEGLDSLNIQDDQRLEDRATNARAD